MIARAIEAARIPLRIVHGCCSCSSCSSCVFIIVAVFTVIFAICVHVGLLKMRLTYVGFGGGGSGVGAIKVTACKVTLTR